MGYAHRPMGSLHSGSHAWNLEACFAFIFALLRFGDLHLDCMCRAVRWWVETQFLQRQHVGMFLQSAVLRSYDPSPAVSWGSRRRFRSRERRDGGECRPRPLRTAALATRASGASSVVY